MQPAPGIADTLHQLALDERVHVLVVFCRRRIEECRIGSGSENLFERRLDAGGFGWRQHAGGMNRVRPGDAALDVVLEQPPIEGEGRTELEEGRIRAALETARPEMRHQTTCGAAAGSMSAATFA